MIKIKHFAEAVESDDGQRIWVEAVGVTRDLREWCSIDHVLSHLGPPAELSKWFDEHPDGYDYFRGKYHECLSHSPYKPALQQLAKAGMKENFTLVHHSDDPQQNSATALYEFLIELSAYCEPEP